MSGVAGFGVFRDDSHELCTVLLPLPGEDDQLLSLGEILFRPMQEL